MNFFILPPKPAVGVLAAGDFGDRKGGWEMDIKKIFIETKKRLLKTRDTLLKIRARNSESIQNIEISTVWIRAEMDLLDEMERLEINLDILGR